MERLFRSRTIQGLGVAGRIVGGVALLASSAMAGPVVTSVHIDDAANTIRIAGTDLARGPQPVRVTLAGVGDITTDCQTPPASDTQIVCTLAEGLPPAGDYLLTIASGHGAADTTSYPLTIGAVGPQGPQGLKGDAGATGTVGPIGLKGDTGATGPQGPKGDTGAVGPAGPKGDTGVTGLGGPQGVQGAVGSTGAQGMQGPPGPIGPAGPAGSGGSPANQTCGSFGLVSGITSEARIRCRCGGAEFRMTATADVDGVLQSWPGDQQTFGDAQCGGTVQLPSGRIDGLASPSGWSLVAAQGFLGCALVPQKPTCKSVAGIAALNGDFPSCSSALGTNASTAELVITCG